MDPSSRSWEIFFTELVNRNVWSTMIFRFFCTARLINSSACIALLVNGFSTKTCLPFSNAAFASSKCDQTGVITAIASISVDAIASVGFESTLIPG